MKQLTGFSLVVITLVLLLSCGGDPAVEEESAGFPSGPHPVVIIAIDGLSHALRTQLVADPPAECWYALEVQRSGGD